jgi:hypothetical protein
MNATIEQGWEVLFARAKELIEEHKLSESTKTIHIQFSLEYDKVEKTLEHKTFIVRNLELEDSICGVADCPANAMKDFEKALIAFAG